MRQTILLLLAGALISLPLPSYADQVSQSDAQKGVSALVKSFDEGWNRDDPKALASQCTEDAIFITPDGVEKGREAIEKNLALRTGKFVHTTTIEGIEGVNNAALAYGRWKNEGKNGGPTFQGFWQAYDVQVGDKWQVKELAINVTPPPRGEASK